MGVNGLLAAGTTGESATLTHNEHHKIIEILVDEVDERVETLAGAGIDFPLSLLDIRFVPRVSMSMRNWE